MAEKEEADEQLRAVSEKLKYKKRQLKEVQEDLRVMQATLSTLGRDQSAYAELLEQKDAVCTQLKRDIEALEARRDRALTQAARVSRDLRRKRRDQQEAARQVLHSDGPRGFGLRQSGGGGGPRVPMG